MARRQVVRGQRSQYGYVRQKFPNQHPNRHLFGWTIAILILTALTIVSWLYPAYIFRNPEKPLNYQILRKVDKLEPLKAFDANTAPMATFFTAPRLFELYSGQAVEDLNALNSLLLRNYVRNYQAGNLIGYVTGDYEIDAVRTLGEDDIFPGVVIRARSIDFPNLILDYLIPSETVSDQHFTAGELLSIQKSGSLAAIIHIDKLSKDRLCISALSLQYSGHEWATPEPAAEDSEIIPPSRSVIESAPPKALNLRAEWPAFGDR